MIYICNNKFVFITIKKGKYVMLIQVDNDVMMMMTTMMMMMVTITLSVRWTYTRYAGSHELVA
jgi:hypothetical protein